MVRKLVDKYLGPAAGFSLVELLLAMLILLLIILAFTPFLLGSITRISVAGDKTEALYEGQSEIEVNIAERQTVDGDLLEFTFGDPANPDALVRVPGGFVDVDIQKGETGAWLSGFVPFVPFIRLDPMYADEGYANNYPLQVNGYFTDFEGAGSVAIKRDEYQETAVQNCPLFGFSVDPDNKDRETASFELQSGLKNSESPYTVSMQWTLAGSVTVDVLARLHVYLPLAVVVGGGQKVLVSADPAATWQSRVYTTHGGTGTLSDVIWTGLQYVAVTGNGRVLAWNNLEEPVVSTTNHYGQLNALAYGNGRYVAVGNNSAVYAAGRAEELVTGAASAGQVPETASERNLRAVAFADGLFVAAGEGSTIIKSSDGGLTWEEAAWSGQEEVDFSKPAVNLNSLVYDGAHWFAVGVNDADSGVVIRSTAAADAWEEVDAFLVGAGNCPALNDIIYDGSVYWSVGDGGAILTSLDGSAWSTVGIEDNNGQADSLTGVDLRAIAWGLSGEDGLAVYYAAVGSGGTVVTSEGGEAGTWIAGSTGESTDLHGVALRWIP